MSGSQGDSVGDGLVIWINGGFGAGKTTAARALVKGRPEMLAFDAEQIGFLLRRAIPKENWPGHDGRKVKEIVDEILARVTQN